MLSAVVVVVVGLVGITLPEAAFAAAEFAVVSLRPIPLPSRDWMLKLIDPIEYVCGVGFESHYRLRRPKDIRSPGDSTDTLHVSIAKFVCKFYERSGCNFRYVTSRFHLRRRIRLSRWNRVPAGIRLLLLIEEKLDWIADWSSFVWIRILCFLGDFRQFQRTASRL